MSQHYTEEQQAAALARYLDPPDGQDGAPLPPELDPEVIGAVYALSPRRAPKAPELDLDALLAGVKEGPFAAHAAPAPEPQPETRPEPPERRPDARRASASAASTSRPPSALSRLLPRRMIPAAGLLAAAALAAVLVIPVATKLGVTEPNPDVLNAPMPEMASATPPPPAKIAEAQPTAPLQESAKVDNSLPAGALPAGDVAVGSAIPEAAPRPNAQALAPAPTITAPGKAAEAPAPTPASIPAPAPPSAPAGGGEGTGYGAGASAGNTGANTGNAGPAPASPAPSEEAAEQDDVGIDQRSGMAYREAEDADTAPAPQRSVAIAEAESKQERQEAKPKASRASGDIPAMAAPAMAAPASSAGGASVWPLDYAEGWYTRYPDITPAYEAALALERARSWAAAAAAWQRLMSDERPSVAQDAAFRAARAWWQAGQASTALGLIDQGLRVSTANTAFRARLYALKADVLIAQGKDREAEAARQQAITLNGAR